MSYPGGPGLVLLVLIGWTLLWLGTVAVVLGAGYRIIRAAVKNGILDADQLRASRHTDHQPPVPAKARARPDRPASW